MEESGVFSLNGYTDQAVDYAKEVQMSLFELSRDGQIRAINHSARTIVENAKGLRPPWPENYLEGAQYVATAVSGLLSVIPLIVLQHRMPFWSYFWTLVAIAVSIYVTVYQLVKQLKLRSIRREWEESREVS